MRKLGLWRAFKEMYLAKLKLWNFRKYGTLKSCTAINLVNPCLEVDFNPKLNVLIGENDSGKTAIIDAIKHVLNTKSLDYLRLEEKDFYQPQGESHERAKELRIECVFKGFDNKEAGSFLEWIGFDDEKKYELKIWLTATRKDQRIITNIRAGHDYEGVQLDGEARENLKVIYLKPLRDALSELTPGYKSRLPQILKSHKHFKDEKDEQGERIEHELEKRANKEISDYFKVDGTEKGKEITEDIKKILDVFSFEGIENNPSIIMSDSELSEILKKLSLVLESDKSGLGSLNKLYMAAEFLLLGQSNERNLKLALIEEIEAHLHPQAQLKIIDALQNTDIYKGQLILTTHSITLASKVKLNHLILCKDSNVYPMFNGKTELGDGDYEFLERFLDDTKANLFFARGVIIVEGDAENLLVPTIAVLLDRPLHKYGVSIVNVGSTAFLRYAKIFQRKDSKILDIPVACIRDLDIAQTTLNDGDIKTKTRKVWRKKYIPEKEDETKKLIQTLEKDMVKLFPSPLWTLEFDILNSENITRELLFAAILEAQLIKGRDQKDKYKGIDESDIAKKRENAKNKIQRWIIEGKSKEWIAYKIYTFYLGNNKISKAVASQRLAKLLKDNKAEVIDILKTSDEFKYIRDAIVHATRKPL